MLDPQLSAALDVMLANPAHWVHGATIGPDGGPHATPLLLGRDDDHLYLSLTGKQKRENLKRDPRICLSIARDEDTAHVVVWGTVTLRHDEWAQDRWEHVIRQLFGPDKLEAMRKPLSEEGTVLGVVDPQRWRIFQVPGAEQG